MLCTYITNFDTFLRHLRPNNNVKCPNSSFCGEREHMTVNFHSLCYLEDRSHKFCYCRIVRPHCRSWTHWNKRKIVRVTRTCIFKWRFRWRYRWGCVKSLIWRLSNDDSAKQWAKTITLHVRFTFWYILCRPVQNDSAKWPHLCFWRTWTHDG